MSSSRNWLGEHPEERFFAQIPEERMLLLIVLLMATAGSIWIDAASRWWDQIPFVSNLVTSILVLAFTLLLVDEYLKWRSDEVWKSVAAFALEDLARVARAVWVQEASSIAPPLETVKIGDYRRLLLSSEGRQNLEDELEQTFLFGDRRQKLFDESRDTAKRTREVIVAWSPTLVPHTQLAPYLAEVSTLHRTLVQVLRAMSIQRRGGELPVSEVQLRTWITDVIYTAIELDARLHREADETDSLVDYVFASDDF